MANRKTAKKHRLKEQRRLEEAQKNQELLGELTDGNIRNVQSSRKY